jgi:hypothetical protein
MKMKHCFIVLIAILFSATGWAQKINNKIVKENLLPGTSDWLINVKYDTCSLPDHRFCRRPQIEGYCSQTSVAQGQSLNLYVSTNPESSFTIDIYRMGYYGGKAEI